MSSKVILGTGRRAAHPYYVERFYVNLYSVEELCFLLVDKAPLLDEEIKQRELVRWLETECGLSELAHTLEALLNKKASVAAFAGAVLSYVNIYPAETVRQTEEIVRGNEGLNPYERLGARADYLFGEKRYLAALRQYRSLALTLPDTEKLLLGRIYHNMGAVYAGMFLYDQAAEQFLKAYETDGKREGLVMYLAALRMGNQEKAYIDYIAEHPEYHELSLEVERLIRRAEDSFEGSDENRMLVTYQVMKEEGAGAIGSSAPYYEEIGELTAGLREQYRKSMR
ncbi:MAG: hypothetical protein NC302_02930 [Bacteroidales bacterium]|nr:hypothetical protein [Bacteroidales bacterium]MCM1415104.1 hypothetical protein [bacterium]MCM1423960.1 hypothetical protein [bacterium]